MTHQDRGEVASALKDQIALVSLLVLFAGLVSTDTYYAGFGLRYQTLDLPLDHLMYRGVTALFHEWLLGFIYVVAVSWLAAGASLTARHWGVSEVTIRVLTYAIVALSVIGAYYAGIRDGRAEAQVDLVESTSRLPIVNSLRVTDQISNNYYDGWRLLFNGKDYIVLFKPASMPAQVPFVHILRGEDVHELVIRQ